MQAVVIFFSVPRLEWPDRGHYSDWTQINDCEAKVRPMVTLIKNR